MEIVPMETLPTGAVALDVAIPTGGKKRGALVIASELTDDVLAGLSEDYSKIYWATCLSPVMLVLVQLRKVQGGLKNVDIHVIPSTDNLVEYIFMNGSFMAHMDETLIKKALTP